MTEMTAAQRIARDLHEHAKYMGHGKCGVKTCVECA